MTRFLRPWRLIIYACIIRFFVSKMWWVTFDLNETVTLKEWESIAQKSFYKELWLLEKYSFKKFLKEKDAEFKWIQVGSYVFSWSYSADELLEVFMAGPAQTYNHITILEWWSSFDVDAYLAEKWVAEAGEYISFVQDQTIIGRYWERYEFIWKAIEEKWSLASLEGYLYPSTFYVDPDKNMIDQLVYLQLEWFKKNIWIPYGEELLSLSKSLWSKWYDFNLSTYWAMTLASIIEKEERVPANRATIASVFYNRLNSWMRIDADISLCYWLKMTHKACTPTVIWNNVYDPSNPYNTRAVSWLPPTPISSLTPTSVEALIKAQPSNNYFYLHDTTWQIHVSKDLWEHNIKKSKYLR